MQKLNCNGSQSVCYTGDPTQDISNITDNTKTDYAGRQIRVVSVVNRLVSTSRDLVKSLTDFIGITKKEEKVMPKLILERQEPTLDMIQEAPLEKIAEIQQAVDEKFNDVPEIYNRWRPTNETLINNELQDQEKILSEKLTKYLQNNMQQARHEQIDQQESKDISFVTTKQSGCLVSATKLFRKKTNIALHSKPYRFEFKNYTLLAGAAETRGNRNYMEDMNFIKSFLIKGNFITINSVCDGHGGKDIATFCVKHLTDKAIENLITEFKQNNKINDIFICNMLRLLTVEAEKEYIKSKKDNLKEYEKYPEAFSQGTTTNICMLTNDAIWTANVGDSRAIIINPRGKAIQTSVTPDLKKQYFQEMVTKRGGDICDVKHNGTYRVNSSLNMASSVGDYHLFGATSPASQITKFVRDPQDISWNGYTLIQVTDGVTNVLTTKKIANLATCYLKEGYSLEKTAEEIVAVAYKLGSQDNITVTLQQRHSSS